MRSTHADFIGYLLSNVFGEPSTDDGILSSSESSAHSGNNTSSSLAVRFYSRASMLAEKTEKLNATTAVSTATALGDAATKVLAAKLRLKRAEMAHAAFTRRRRSEWSGLEVR
jgi:hypothetical protein